MPDLFNENESEEKMSPSDKKRNESIIKNIDSMLDQMELSLYGTTKKADQESLISQFNTIVKSQMDGLNHQQGNDVSSFMAKLYDSDKKRSWNSPDLETFLNSDDGQVINFLSDAYKNDMVKFQDLNEICSQLIELNEAILVTRDAIVSPDLTDGGVSRSFEFDSDEDDENYSSKIKNMEENFKLQQMVKNHIIPKTLSYGQYYAYIIPYSKIFSDFSKKMNDPVTGRSFVADAMHYQESTLMDFYEESVKDQVTNKTSMEDLKENYLRECAEEFVSQFSDVEIRTLGKSVNATDKENFTEKVMDEIGTIMDNIVVYPEDTPIPFVTEGADSLAELFKEFSESGEKNLFTEVTHMDKGVYDTKDYKKKVKKTEKDFGNITDCYIKQVDPIHMRPLKILNRTIGYFYIREEDIKPSTGILSSTIYYNKYDKNGRQRTIIDNLVNRIVCSFDKKFLKTNADVKEIIADALMYYDLNSKKLKFQYIPVEYVCEFKVNEDENKNGVSIVQPSLFYAKLYLMLLLFKITSIILYSNDQKVNYIKTSGIDKNIANKIQQIARDKQNHQINIMDLMSYTTMLRKVGNGGEMYIPTGRNGEKGFETEILQGQEVQLNNDLMELLRNSYILGTGVPSAIMNYLNEADFAKSIEVANTRFQGRVMSYQIDFNESITRFYQMVAKYSGITDNNGKEIHFKFTLTPPKFTNNVVKQDALGAFDAMKQSILTTVLGDQWNNDPVKIEIAEELTRKIFTKYMPAIDLEEIMGWKDEIQLNLMKKKLEPENKNTDNIDDFDDEQM
jgi:hypothetical protein